MGTTNSQDSETESSYHGPTLSVGLVADPVAAPAAVGHQLARDLPDMLSTQLNDGHRWRVEVVNEQLPASDNRHTELVEVAHDRMTRHGWDLAVCVTDQPLRTGREPIVGDVSKQHGVAVVSLPAFGAMLLRRRVRDVVIQQINDLRTPGTPEEGTPQHRRRRVAGLSRNFRRVTPDQGDIDVRIMASRGRTRLLVGMVRDNRPWRLVLGLAGPLAGAFAFSAFYLISTTLWQLASSMEPWRLVLTAIGSVLIMVVWLIVYHSLWEPVRHRPIFERDQAILFNISTILTLIVGVGIMYSGLYVANLAVSAVVLTPSVFGRYVGSTAFSEYALAMLVVSAAATVAGAIGSGFQSENSIREAAFSYRERERRQALREAQARREQRDRDEPTDTR